MERTQNIQMGEVAQKYVLNVALVFMIWFDPNNSLFEFHFYNRDSTCWSHKLELASTGYGYGKWRQWSFIAKEFDNFCTLEEHYITYHDNETPEEIHVPPNT